MLTPPSPDAVAIVFEINRLAAGGAPHAADSREAQALDRSLHRCAQTPDLAALAAIARRAIAAARASQPKELQP